MPGRRAATPTGRGCLTAAGAAVRTWDVNAGKSIKQWSYQEPRGDQAYVFDVQPAPRDADDALRATIACAVSDGTARVRDVRLGYDARVLRAPGDSKVTAVGWLGGAPSRRVTATGCRVWDARTWKLLARLKGAHASPCYGAAKTDGFVASWAAEGLAFWSCEDALEEGGRY